MTVFPTIQNTDDPLAQGLDVAINDHLFRSVLTADRGIDIGLSDRTAQRIQENAEDYQEEAVYSFSRNNFQGGAGLYYAHRRNLPENAAQQYLDSYCVKVSDRGVELAFTYASLDATGANPSLAILGDDLFHANGNNVDRVSNFLGTPSTATETVTGNTSPVLMIATAGDEILAVSADGLFKRDNGGTWASVTTASFSAADGVWFVKGRAIISDGVDLYESTTPYTADTKIDTLPPGQTWTDVSDLGASMLAGATDGSLRTFTGGSSALTLDNIFKFESGYPLTLASAYSKVLIGLAEIVGSVTNGQVWEGNVIDGQITGLSLIRNFNDGSGDHAPRGMTFADDSIYFVVNDPQYDRVHIYNYYLPTAGLHREGLVISAETPHDMVVKDGRICASTISDNVYLEQTTYETDGWIITPFGDFFASLQMEWHEAVMSGIVPTSTSLLQHVTGDTSYLTYFPSDPFAYGSFFQAVTSTQETGEVRTGINVSSTALATQVRLRTTDTQNTPTLQNVSLHAYPPVGDFLIQIPVNVSDVVRRPGKATVEVPGFGETTYTVLRSFMTGIVEVETLREPFERIRGVVERVSTPVTSNHYGGARITTSTIVIRGRPSTDLAQTGSGGYNSPQLFGLILYGGEDLET